MKTNNKSIFNLIEIFRRDRQNKVRPVLVQSHCEQKGMHDFYCDAEKPFISQ